MRLSLGPLLYLWERERVLDFYDEIAESPVDIVYLGETVCAKRRNLRPDDWLDIGWKLAGRGKEVVLSTLALIEAESEGGQMARVCRNGEFLVEANDIGAVGELLAHGVEFVAGPGLNVYSGRTLAWMQRAGLVRWVPPVEMSRDQIVRVIAELGGTTQAPDVELFAYGRMPLAYSARCFTARAHGRTKDTCGFICGDYAEGLPADTQDGKPLFTLNGIQTQSGSVVNLLPLWREAEAAGVGVMRISPRPTGTGAVIAGARAALDAEGTPEREADLDPRECNGYWYGRAGLERVLES